MWYDRFARRSLSVAVTAALALTIAACDDDDDNGGLEPQEPDIATMRLTIDQTAVDFVGGCTPSVASVVIPTTGASIQADFLRADNTADPLVTEADFELQVEPADRFTRTSAFAGTLSGGAVGTAQISFSLFHVGQNHVEFGPCSLGIDVQ
jgi:hypothetical protein